MLTSDVSICGCTDAYERARDHPCHDPLQECLGAWATAVYVIDTISVHNSELSSGKCLDAVVIVRRDVQDCHQILVANALDLLLILFFSNPNPTP